MAQRQKDQLTLVAVGDISPNREDPPSIFRYCRDIFSEGDVVFGHLEFTLSDRGTRMLVRHRPHPLSPKSISALTEKGAGFHVMSFAANAAMDYGMEAFLDTLDILKKNNITLVGAGMNIMEARKPAIVERKGTRIGFLAYLSIIHRDNVVAQEDTPGCAPLRASHSYEQVDHQPGTPPLIVTKLFPEDLKAMEEDIRKLRPQVDVLVVSMHCGVHFAPAIIAMYQKEAGRAAVDAGADLVLQHHAHILKGIEVYKGKVIFYGLGNFAVEHIVGRPGASAFYRVKAEPGWEKHFFPRDSLKTMMVKAYIQDKHIRKVTYIPAHINPNLEPEVVKREDPRAQEIFDYVIEISEREDLKVNFSWEGDEVLVS
jgi:poly-gamma-glutamate capsule biosynthesis protein CapA/YwtB (metallophosphatase superfamily)